MRNSSKNRALFSKNFNQQSKENMKSLTEDMEKLKKRMEKLRSQNANLKINEKKLANDNSILTQKIQFLNKENNELKHRLNKLVGSTKKTSSSRSKRLGSNLSRMVKNSTKNLYFDKKKHSQACISPRMKKMDSEHSLLPLNSGKKVNKFGRRDTLDVNKSGNLLMFGINDEHTRNSEINNFNTCEERYRSKLCNSNCSRGNINNCSKNKMSMREECNCQHTSMDRKVCGQALVDKRQDYRYSCMANSVVDTGRESIEKELYNQVSNVVSSFFSKYDGQPQHFRGKSKSDLGFVRNMDTAYTTEYGHAQCQNQASCGCNAQKVDNC